MEWKVKYIDNPKMQIIVKLNSDLTIDVIGQYRRKNQWYDIVERKFNNFDIMKEEFTNYVMEFVKVLLNYEQTLHKMDKFFDNYSEFEFVQ